MMYGCEKCPYDDVVQRARRIKNLGKNYQPQYLACDKVGGEHWQYGYCEYAFPLKKKNKVPRKEHTNEWRYAQNKKHEARDLKIAKSDFRYPMGMWIDWEYDENIRRMVPIGNHVKRSKNSNRKVFYKRYTSRKLRRTLEVPNGNFYRKSFDLWWILY